MESMTFTEQLKIFKIGGQLLEEKEALENWLTEFSRLEGPKIVVHGGGKKASDLAEQLGISVEMQEGRRITSAPMLEVATMVYAGFYNKQLVSRLQALGCMALGMCGADLDSIRAKKRAVHKIDFGWVGDVEKINTAVLQQLLKGNICPVFCALSYDGQGQLLNTNADTIATELAIAFSPLYEVELNFCLELPGVMTNPEQADTLLPHINRITYSQLKETGQISGGMIPKLDNAFRALHQQVPHVQIGNSSNVFTQKGTQLC